MPASLISPLCHIPLPSGSWSMRIEGVEGVGCGASSRDSIDASGAVIGRPDTVRQTSSGRTTPPSLRDPRIGNWRWRRRHPRPGHTDFALPSRFPPAGRRPRRRSSTCCVLLPLVYFEPIIAGRTFVRIAVEWRNGWRACASSLEGELRGAIWEAMCGTLIETTLQHRVPVSEGCLESCSPPWANHGPETTVLGNPAYGSARH